MRLAEKALLAAASNFLKFSLLPATGPAWVKRDGIPPCRVPYPVLTLKECQAEGGNRVLARTPSVAKGMPQKPYARRHAFVRGKA
jgi:hypothetical protein